MQDVVRKEIDGQQFEVTQLPVKEAKATFVRLTRLLGPSLAELSRGEGLSIGDIDTSVIGQAIARLMVSWSEEDLDRLVSTFAKCSRVELSPGVWVQVTDEIFRGRLLTMFKWLGFAMQVNYSDFLGEFTRMSALLSAKSQTASKSQSPTS